MKNKLFDFLFTAFLILSLVIFPFGMCASADDPSNDEPEKSVYDLELSAPKSVKQGEVINVVCTVKNITSENGLLAVEFTLVYDETKVVPNVISNDMGDPEPYQQFITKSPQYIMSFGGMDFSVTCYENISRNFGSYYDFTYVDMQSYPNKKAGTTVDPVLRDDGDLILTIPFTVRSHVEDGEKIAFEAINVKGTDAGTAYINPYSVKGTGSKATVVAGDPSIAFLKGDINGDSEIDSADANMILKYDAGIVNISDETLIYGDVNNDGDVDSLDANIIMKYDAGLISSIINN